MEFKNIQRNHPVYLLDKQTVEVKEGKVVDNQPHINTGIATISSSGQSMRDVTIEVEGKQTIYTIPEHLGVTFAGEIVLATDKADLLPEVGKLVNEADEIIKAYVAKHGYHFTKQLAIKASEQMKNVDGTSHRWTVDEIRLATNNEIISKGTTLGDILYLANMAYADFYPKVIKTESDCVQYAIAVASDPDGYEGVAFCRWTADIIGKGVTIDWEKLE